MLEKPDKAKLEKLKTKVTDKRFLMIALVFLLFAVILLFYLKDYRNIANIDEFADLSVVKISVPSGYYQDEVKVKLSLDVDAPLGTKIYYSLDGKDPKTLRYKKTITLKKEPGTTKLYVLKAAAYYKGGFSSSACCTYLVGDNVRETYGADIISVTSDEYGLYDYDIGIFADGRTYDENKAKGAEFIEGNWRQRGDEWIRDAQATMFSADGTLLFSQDVGLAVSGGTSSGFKSKSLKIIAGEEYDAEHLHIDFKFPSPDTTLLSEPTEYHSLRLRSGSQDMNYSNIRSSVASRLCEKAGLDICCGTNRAILFLNNEFWGVYDIQQNYSDSYLKNHFSLPDSELITKWRGNEIAAFEHGGITELIKKDLTVAENRKALEEKVDMDSYLLYYAAEILMNNNDWPGNNYEMWRYDGGYDGTNPYTDGRFRFLLYDMDLIYFMQEDEEEFFEGCKRNVLDSLMNNLYRTAGSSFPHVMEYEGYRDKFFTYLCDLMNASFNPEDIAVIVDEEHAKLENAYELFYDKKEIETKNGLIENIKENAAVHEKDLLKSVDEFFGLSEMYDLKLSCSEGVRVYWNKNEVFGGEDFSGRYYKGISFTVKADAYPNYKLVGFEVNGETVEGDTLVITPEMTEKGELTVKAVAERQANAELLIQEVCAKSDTDWIKLENYGSEAVDLSRYYISDNADKPLMFNLPKVTLKSGESFVINCNRNYYEVKDYICNFNLADGETLYLYDTKLGKTVDSMYVPRMDRHESYGRYLHSNAHRFFENTADKRKAES